jgi:transcriptional regulator with XRE-family HTH domain
MKLTIREAARRADVSHSYWSYVEAGKRTRITDAMLRIFKAVGLEIKLGPKKKKP